MTKFIHVATGTEVESNKALPRPFFVLAEENTDKDAKPVTKTAPAKKPTTRTK